MFPYQYLNKLAANQAKLLTIAQFTRNIIAIFLFYLGGPNCAFYLVSAKAAPNLQKTPTSPTSPSPESDTNCPKNSPKKHFILRGQEINYNAQQNYAEINGQAFAQETTFNAATKITTRQTLTADRFKVTFAKNKSPRNNATSGDRDPLSSPPLESIQAVGSVKLEQADLVIAAKNCNYYVATLKKPERIICTGDVVIKKGNNVLKGDQAEIDLTNGTYKIKTLNSPAKVEIIIATNSKC